MDNKDEIKYSSDEEDKYRKINKNFDKSIYLKKNIIGKGASADIHMALNRNNKKQRFAVKMIKHHSDLLKKHSSDSFKKIVLNEITIQMNSRFRHIAAALGYYNLGNDTYALVQEYASKGNLKEFLKDIKKKRTMIKKSGTESSYSESLICMIAYNLFHGLNHLYHLNVLHQDIKAENVLINEKYEIKITDFSVSVKLEPNNIFYSFESSGTAIFFSPEKIRNKLVLIEDSYKSDYYSLGLLIYQLIFGFFPFKISTHDKMDEIYSKMRNHKLEFPENIEVSQEFKDLIEGLLKFDYKDRFSIKNILDCKWIKKGQVLNSLKENYKDLDKFFLDLYDDNIILYDK